MLHALKLACSTAGLPAGGALPWQLELMCDLGPAIAVSDILSGVMNLALMFGLGAQELVLILLIVVVIFGASRIPQLMRGMGTGIKEFKKAVKDDDEPRKIPEKTGEAEENE